ncbi:hypothetical protein ONZ45_g6123 [Pleurotus djamor]|nr:hypothetical protein ONZ45_g6123 [Pleurotus djamor]
MLTLSPFPLGYYASGDFASDCSPLAPSDDSTYEEFKFCEDITFWDVSSSDSSTQTRHVIASCDFNRNAWNTVMGPLRDPDPRGSLWLYTSTEENPKPRRITFENYPEGHDFHPLGLEISHSLSGEPSNLFVVNHARKRTTIEQFTVNPNTPTTATYIRTLSSPYFVSPNSVALTSPTSFYVTNDHFFTRRLPFFLGNILPIIESVLALPLSWVAHIELLPNPNDPSGEPIFSHTPVAYGIPFANGIAMSPDGSTVAVSATSSGLVYFYSRNQTDNSLKHTDTVPVPFTPDNLQYDESGVLIVTGHPHFPSLIKVAADKPGAVAPSWVVSITPRVGGKLKSKSIFAPNQAYDTQAPISASLKAPAMLNHEVITLFQSNGTGFSTSATGLRDTHTGDLYVSGLYAKQGVIVCHPSN